MLHLLRGATSTRGCLSLIFANTQAPRERRRTPCVRTRPPCPPRPAERGGDVPGAVLALTALPPREGVFLRAHARSCRTSVQRWTRHPKRKTQRPHHGWTSRPRRRSPCPRPPRPPPAGTSWLVLWKASKELRRGEALWASVRGTSARLELQGTQEQLHPILQMENRISGGVRNAPQIIEPTQERMGLWLASCPTAEPGPDSPSSPAGACGGSGGAGHPFTVLSTSSELFGCHF